MGRIVVVANPNLDSREPFIPSSYSCEHCGGIVLIGSLCECETWDYDDEEYNYEDYEEYFDND